MLVFGATALGVSAGALQIASTVTLEGSPEVTEGLVITAQDEDQTYTVSKNASDAQVFGVTAAKPSLVFTTEGHQVPVVTEGIAFVQVVTSNGVIQRGDLLVTSSTTGAAMRAGELDQHVFAIALETYENIGEVGVIQAEVGVEGAQGVRAMQAVLSSEDTSSLTPSVVRGAVAVVLVVGALFFILYSFRSTITQGVVSVGRNPRAQRSIVTLSFANIAFALVLCAVVIFIAIAILILPL